MDIEDKIWTTVGICLLICVMIVLMSQFFSNKPVQGYYLSSSESSHGLQIGVDIDYAVDEHIPLIGVGYAEAVRLVNQLNAGRAK